MRFLSQLPSPAFIPPNVCEIDGRDDPHVCQRYQTVGVLLDGGVACVGERVGCMSEASYMHI